MILVTVGTSETPFDRLLEAFDVDDRPDEELLVQCGSSGVRPRGASCVDFLSYDELVDAIRRSRVLVTHAGVGSIMTALANGKRPIVVPRLARLGEAVDDHQIDLGRRLAALDLVVLVEDEGLLLAEVARAEGTAGFEPAPSPRLVADLKEFIASRRPPAK